MAQMGGLQGGMGQKFFRRICPTLTYMLALPLIEVSPRGAQPDQQLLAGLCSFTRRGFSVKQRKITRIFSVRTTREFAVRAQELARRHGMKRSGYVVQLLERELALAGMGDLPKEAVTPSPSE